MIAMSTTMLLLQSVLDASSVVVDFDWADCKKMAEPAPSGDLLLKYFRFYFPVTGLFFSSVFSSVQQPFCLFVF